MKYILLKERQYQSIYVFNNGANLPSSQTVTIITVDDDNKRIKVSDLDVLISGYGGGFTFSDTQNAIFSAANINDLITSGFGKLVDGSDCGAFVEFIFNINGSEPVPRIKYYHPEGLMLTSYRFYWFDHFSSMDNIFYLLIADDNMIPVPPDYEGEKIPGLTGHLFNFTIIYDTVVDNIYGPIDKIKAKKDLVVHEFGHQYIYRSPCVSHLQSNLIPFQTIVVIPFNNQKRKHQQIFYTHHPKVFCILTITVIDIGQPN